MERRPVGRTTGDSARDPRMRARMQQLARLGRRRQCNRWSLETERSLLQTYLAAQLTAQQDGLLEPVIFCLQIH